MRFEDTVISKVEVTKSDRGNHDYKKKLDLRVTTTTKENKENLGY